MMRTRTLPLDPEGPPQARVINLGRPDGESLSALLPSLHIATAVPPPRRPWRWLVLALPTVLAALYLFTVAEDRYETEARLVIRTATQSEAAGALSLGLPAVMSGANADEGHIARDFVLSRDALAFLATRHDLRLLLNPAGPDFPWRFPRPWGRDTNEALFRHYLRFVDARFDAASGILTLHVRAFTATAAEELARGLVTATEDLVNRLNQRPTAAALANAGGEVDRARARAAAAQNAVRDWRDRNQMVDPSRMAFVYAETIARLSLEVAQTSATIAELRRTSPRSPQLDTLAVRANAIRAQIEAERQAMAGTRSDLARQIAQYEGLQLEREFAERTFQSALASQEAARRDAERQRLFLEQLVQPRAPDWPAYPHTLLWLLAVAGLNVAAVAAGRAVVGDTASHGRP